MNPSPPRIVAILGASADRAKFGNKAVRAFQQQGFTVYPVNPRETVIEGLSVFRSLAELPARPQLVSVYLPPAVVLKVLPEIAARGCDELWLTPGTESDDVLAEAARLGLNVILACSIVALGLEPEAM
jgi:predicted CoA-binding protein